MVGFYAKGHQRITQFEKMRCCYNHENRSDAPEKGSNDYAEYADTLFSFSFNKQEEPVNGQYT